MRSLEERVLEGLDPEEGAERFNLPCTPRQASGALQRLKRKGLVEATQCPDGAWVWFYTGPERPEDVA